MCMGRSPSNGVVVIIRFMRISAPSGAAPPAASWRRRTSSNQPSERKRCLATEPTLPVDVARKPDRLVGKLRRFAPRAGERRLAKRTVTAATALMAGWAILAPACGGTLEGKYRRGELTTTTTGGNRAPATGGATTTTTSTTGPTSGNAAGRVGPGEPEAVKPGGTIVGSATWRIVVPPSGGRHR